MSTTQPIRNLVQISKLKNYYYKEKPNLRNYTLICLGINSALRISDLLELKWKDVFDFSKEHFLSHLNVQEQKTGKHTRIALNRNALDTLELYRKSLPLWGPELYLFPGRNPNSHMCRSQAFRIIKEAGQQLHPQAKLSCHSLRKTFGYHAWKAGTPPVILMAVYNHSSFQITKRYLGIEQDDKDDVFLKTNL